MLNDARANQAKDSDEEDDEMIQHLVHSRVKQNCIIREKKEILLKLSMMLSLKCLRGDLYIPALLEKIKLTKEVFIYDVEQGTEVFIPCALTQYNMPVSFIYYDSTIALI